MRCLNILLATLALLAAATSTQSAAPCRDGSGRPTSNCSAAPALVAAPVKSKSVDKGAALARGQLIAERRCGACHAIGRTGDSRNSLSPPFRRLHEQLPVRDVIQALGEGAKPSHPGMPPFRMSFDETQDLIAYVESLAR